MFRERVVNTSRSRLEEVNIQGLQPDRTYNLRVGAYFNDSLGATSPPLTVHTKAEVHVPGPPLHVTARPLSSTSIHVEWQPPTPSPDPITGPVLGYSIYYIEVIIKVIIWHIARHRLVCHYHAVNKFTQKYQLNTNIYKKHPVYKTIWQLEYHIAC